MSSASGTWDNILILYSMYPGTCTLNTSQSCKRQRVQGNFYIDFDQIISNSCCIHTWASRTWASGSCKHEYCQGNPVGLQDCRDSTHGFLFQEAHALGVISMSTVEAVTMYPFGHTLIYNLNIVEFFDEVCMQTLYTMDFPFGEDHGSAVGFARMYCVHSWRLCQSLLYCMMIIMMIIWKVCSRSKRLCCRCMCSYLLSLLIIG